LVQTEIAFFLYKLLTVFLSSTLQSFIRKRRQFSPVADKLRKRAARTYLPRD